MLSADKLCNNRDNGEEHPHRGDGEEEDHDDKRKRTNGQTLPLFFKVKKQIFFTRKPNFMMLWIHRNKQFATVLRNMLFHRKKLKISVFSQRKRRFNLFRHVDTPKFCNLVTPREVSQNL